MKRLLFLSFLFLSCKKDSTDINSISNNKVSLVWKTKLTNNIMFGSVTPVIINNEVAFYAQEDAKTSPANHVFIDKSNGTINWRWNDQIDKNRYSFMGKSYGYNNFLCITDINGSYVIDTKLKTTVAKHSSVLDVRNEVVGLNEDFFYTEIPEESKDNRAGHGTMINVNILTGKKNVLFNISIDKDSANQYITDNFYVRAVNGDKRIYFGYINASYQSKLQHQDSMGFLKVFSMNQNKFTDSLCVDKYAVGSIYYLNEKIYYVTPSRLVCMNEKTHEVYWKIDYDVTNQLDPNSVLFDEKTETIYASKQDLQFNLIALDINNGRIKWKSNIGNHCTKPFVMNGVVYITVGPLVAFNASTGEQLFYVYPEDLNASDMSSFKNHNVIGDGERIYVSSGMYAYCLEGK